MIDFFFFVFKLFYIYLVKLLKNDFRFFGNRYVYVLFYKFFGFVYVCILLKIYFWVWV